MNSTLITDCHIGNERCPDNFGFFKDFVIPKAINEGCQDQLICLGDFLDNGKLSNHNLEEFIKITNLLSDSFKDVIMVIGNHDVWNPNNLNNSPIQIMGLKENIHVIDKPTLIKRQYFIPHCNDELLIDWIKEEEGNFDLIYTHLGDSYCNYGNAKLFELLQKEIRDNNLLIYSGHIHTGAVNGSKVNHLVPTFRHSFTEMNCKQGIYFTKGRGLIFEPTPETYLCPYLELKIKKLEDYVFTKVNNLINTDSISRAYIRLIIDNGIPINYEFINSLKTIARSVQYTITDNDKETKTIQVNSDLNILDEIKSRIENYEFKSEFMKDKAGSLYKLL